MNRKQRVRMLVYVLLAPFLRPPFGERDFLAEKAQAFRNLKEATIGQEPQKRERYKIACNAAVSALQSEVQPDRLSELSMLLNKYYPDGELSDYLAESDSSHLACKYFEVLMQLSKETVTLLDGVVSLKMWNAGENDTIFPEHSGLYKAELWSEISRTITPDILIAAYFVNAEIRDVEYLRELPGNLFLHDSLMMRLLERGVAETHLHLNSGMSYLSVWSAVTDIFALRSISRQRESAFRKIQKDELENNHMLLLAGLLRVILAAYLESDSALDIAEYFYTLHKESSCILEKQLVSMILGAESNVCPDRFYDFFNSNKQSYLLHLKEAYDINTQERCMDLLECGVYGKYRPLHAEPELLLLFFALWHLRRYPHHTGFARVLLCYIRIKNRYFKDKIQANTLSGLTFFRRFFRSVTQALSEHDLGDNAAKIRLSYKAAFRNQFHCRFLKKLEVKIAPPRIPADATCCSESSLQTIQKKIAHQLYQVFSCYLEVMQEQNEFSRDNVPTLGVVYHLMRPDNGQFLASSCWAMPRQRQPSDPVSRVRREAECFVKALRQMLRDVPHLAEFVVGLDAASEELYCEPWVFAPVFRQARSRELTYPVQLSSGAHLQTIGLTYHVGEDYHHLLSGLRHIDEVTTYFGYKTGDRLAHGIVLQLDPEEWVCSNEIVSMPTMEYLENLLWLWSVCSEDTALTMYLPHLEKRIMEMAESIYSNIRGLSPYLLCAAYRRKFEELTPEFCERVFQTYLHEPEQRTSGCRYDSLRSFCALCETDSPHADVTWDADKLLLTHHCAVYARRYSEPILIANRRSDVDLLKAAQSYVRKKVRNLGVFVEVNPTSNIAIGDCISLYEYPISRLNAPRSGDDTLASVLISINSDNPLIFNTNVENELALVYHAMNYQQIGREDVLQWIDRIRQYGLDSSFIRKIYTFEEQQHLLEHLLEDLRKIWS